MSEELQQGSVDVNAMTHNAVFSACEKGQQQLRALHLPSKLQQSIPKVHVITCSAAISACEKTQQWQRAWHDLVRYSMADMRQM